MRLIKFRTIRIYLLFIVATSVLTTMLFLTSAFAFPSDSALEEHRRLLPSFPLATLMVKNKGGSPRLREVLLRHADQKQSEFTGFSLDAIKTWDESRALVNKKFRLNALQLLNSRINETPYHDVRPLGTVWMTPVEFVSAGGNCTGYAVAKLIALKEGGWPLSTFVLLIGHLLDDTPHAVVAVSILGEPTWYILDNRHADLRASTDVLDFVPWFTVSLDTTWLYDHDLEAIERLKAGLKASIVR